MDDSRQRLAPAESPARPTNPADGRDRLVRLAYRFLWNREDAEDVAQNALAIAQREAAGLRDPAKWWSWVCRIVVRQCHTLSRGKARVRRHMDRFGPAGHAGHEPATSAEGTARGGELKQVIRAMLLDLPPRQRDVLVLRHLEGMGFDEIANILEISVATARVHAMHGREALRNMIAERYGELLAD